MYKQFSNLLQPIKVGNVIVKNRFWTAPMGLMELLDENGYILDNGLEYFVERAKGGFGVITVPAVHPDTEVDPVLFKCSMDGEYVRRQKLLLDRCHGYGAKVFIQISFGVGRNGIPGCKSSDALPYYFAPDEVTPVLSTEEIKKKIGAVIGAAKFLKDIGFDGVEMHAMHWGYLLDQLAMSMTNHRRDEYGGNLENRLRAAKELVQGIKEVCGEGFPVGMRLGIKSFVEGLHKPSLNGENEAGRTIEEAVEVAKLLEKYGYDVLSVDAGIYDSFYYMLPPTYLEQGYLLPYVERVKREVSIPVIAAGGRMNDPCIADKAIGEGRLDGVVLGRQSLADPEYPNKIAMGRPERVRPCICCNLGCNGEGALGKYTCCAVNPVSIKEGIYEMKPVFRPKKIGVIGGGVAGMEFAYTAALRGHKVEIYEKEDKMGGLLLAAGHHDFKSEIEALNLWFQNELRELGVSIHLGMELGADEIRDLDVDTVVLTTGARPVMPPISGIDHEKTVDCISAVMGTCALGERVVIIGGGLTGCEIGYDLARKGKKVTIVDGLDQLMASGTPLPNKLMMEDLLKQYEVEVFTGYRIKEVHEGGAVIVNRDGEEKLLEADQVVMAVGFRARPSMANELYGCGKEIYSLVTGTGSIMDSIRNGYELAHRI
ncbi:MAG: FAD-dependent oxidoreductase [Lachnospiraceae bacterium]|nr:FAD-dependent oxidoreductase [Lachnospiraceae bacterium]